MPDEVTKTITKTLRTPNGDLIRISVTCPRETDPAGFFVLRESAAIQLAECMIDLADTLRPKPNREYLDGLSALQKRGE